MVDLMMMMESLMIFVDDVNQYYYNEYANYSVHFESLLSFLGKFG